MGGGERFKLDVRAESFNIFNRLSLSSPSFFFSSRRRHTRSLRDWSSDVCSSDLGETQATLALGDLRICMVLHDGSRSEERRVGKECRDRWKLDDHEEIFNIFNRLFLSSPSGVGQTTQPAGPNPAAPIVQTGGILTSGYGVVNTSNITLPGQIPGNGSQPRTGQIVARFSF